MTAWMLGETGTQNQARRTLDEEDRDALSFVGTVLEWIPADVVALFAAAITAFEVNPVDDASKLLIGGGVVLAVLAVLLGAFAAAGDFTSKVWVRAALAPIAFLIWSPTVPNSGWEDITWVADNPELTVLACAVAAFLFALVAKGLDARVSR